MLDSDLKAGEDALERAAQLLAKAQDGADPDEDFAGYDNPEPHEDEEDADDAQADEQAQGEDGQDEDQGEDEEEQPKTIAKAGEFVDATPILEALDGKLAAIESASASLDSKLSRLATLAKAIDAKVENFLQVAKAQQVSLEHFAKGAGFIAEQPRRPKSQRVSVSTQTRLPDARTFMAKAMDVVAEADRIGVIEHYVNRGQLEQAAALLSPEELNKIIG